MTQGFINVFMNMYVCNNDFKKDQEFESEQGDMHEWVLREEMM